MLMLVSLGLMNFNYLVIGGDSLSKNYQTTVQTGLILDQVASDPIIITGNSDFVNLGFSGLGTEQNPYLIQGLSIIAASHLITISNTNAYFVIQDNFLQSTNSPDYIGIQFENVVNGHIKSNVIMNVDQGIGVFLSNNIKIQNNTISEVNAAGIDIFDFSSNIEVVDNNIQNSNDGILLFGSANNNAINNNTISFLSGTGIGIEGNNNQIINNEIYNTDSGGISVLGDNNTIDTNRIYNIGQIGISYSGAENSIMGNIIYDSNRGIGVEQVKSKNQISNNEIFNNIEGIILGNSDNQNISFNKVYQNGIGMGIAGSSNILTSNELSSNMEAGIRLDFANNNQITENMVINNGPGIDLFQSSDNLIASNYVEDNNLGIHLDMSSDRNTVTSNFIYRNFETGVFISGESADNQITQNDIIGNLDPNGQASVDGPNNSFVNNFWGNADDDSIISGSRDIEDTDVSLIPFYIPPLNLEVNIGENAVIVDVVSFAWNNLTDLRFDIISFNLGYSLDEGVSWTTLHDGPAWTTEWNHNFSDFQDSFIRFSIQVQDEIGTTTFDESDIYVITTSEHKLSGFEIVKPTPGDEVSDVIEILWTSVFDNYLHDLEYTVEYLHNQGTDWVVIGDHLTTTSVDWNTTVIANGFYLIKITALDLVDGDQLVVVLANPIEVKNAIPSSEQPPSLLPYPIWLVLVVIPLSLLRKRKPSS